MPVLRYGLVADTHGVFDPALEAPLAGVSAILHAGDVGNHGGASHVLARFQAIAPTTAVAGNVDDDAEAAALLPDSALLTLNGWRVLLLHVLDSAAGRAALAAHRPVDVVVHGHSHKYSVAHSVGSAPPAAAAPAPAPAAAAPAAAHDAGWRLAVNPGSAGPARFSLGRSAAVLTLPPKGSGQPTVERVELPAKAPPRLPEARKQRQGKEQRRQPTVAAGGGEAKARAKRSSGGAAARPGCTRGKRARPASS